MIAIRRALCRIFSMPSQPITKKRRNPSFTPPARPARSGCRSSISQGEIMKDRLFLLRPGFFKGEKGPFYCAESASVEGLLGFFPQLREMIDVEYIDFPRPRQVLVELLGNDHQ